MNLKNIILGIGIVVVFALTLWQGIEAFYPSPEYTDYCPEMRSFEFVNTSERCNELEGKWNSYYPKTEIEGYCDLDFYCREDYNDAQDQRSQRVFFISLIIGIIALIIGYSVLKVEPVGSALMASGIWSFFYGSVINWRNFSDIWRFLLLVLALILLIWLALRLNSTKKRKFWFRK